MNIWLYLPEQYYNCPVTRILGDTISEVFTNVEDDIADISKVGDVAEMPVDLLNEWLRLNDISTTGSEDLDRQLFKRYYSLMRRRGTVSAISRAIENGGSIYSVDMNKFHYKVFKGTDKMMKYCRKITNHHTFNPDMYCPGVFFIETTNINAVNDNPLLDKVFPAGCKYYVSRVLLPKTIAMNISKIDFMKHVESHHVFKVPEVAPIRCSLVELNSYGTQLGDVFKTTWNYLDFRSYEFLDGDSVFYVDGCDITKSRRNTIVNSSAKMKSASTVVEYNSSEVSMPISSEDTELSKLLSLSDGNEEVTIESMTDKLKAISGALGIVSYDKHRDTKVDNPISSYEIGTSDTDLTTNRAPVEILSTDAFKDTWVTKDVEEVGSIDSMSLGYTSFHGEITKSK